MIEGGSAKVGLVKGREKGESHGDDEIIVNYCYVKITILIPPVQNHMLKVG